METTNLPQPPKTVMGLDPKIAVLLCALWVLSPLDPIPEIILGPCLGLLDDLGVVGVGIYSLVQWLSLPRPSPFPPAASAQPVPRTLTVVGRTVPPVHPTARAVPIMSIDDEEYSAPQPAAVFTVQVVNSDGDEQRVEVEAPNAEAARAKVRALGADGEVGKVWLKGLRSNDQNGRLNGGTHDALDA